ncbi:cytochrome-c peroxidase [Methylobacter sp. YRD-M1]|uniref:cytochrome-c peroxidase n=1 Tax=Methylobacter sp. YRD-M1 TaxID=2911520 RepID=UPI00227BC162|nr:cytochrome c peroxidase [Methylobacter sp. YRD-M1]WAK01580.1 cytochrome-c peroxidase [Methylobacter sp. YRD-M1]
MIHFDLSSRLKLKTTISAVSLMLSALTPSLTFAISANNADFPARNAAKEELGKFLFYDKILSGNKNTSCATCHHPLAGTGDGLSLGVGEGGRGLGIMRDTGSGSDAIHERVPRNAPFVFNLGASEFVRVFHDGRVEKDSNAPSGFRTPAGDAFLPGIDHALAAQAAFPPTSNTEMAGQAGENEVADAAAAGDVQQVWSLLTARVMAIDEYRTLFAKAYPDLKVPEEITFAHLANAIGAFEAAAYRADNSPYDYYMMGQTAAMSKNAVEGMKTFYGRGQCASCHSGKFQTDHAFHALGMPQIGPGKGDGFEGHDDYGREQVTGDANDRYKFRTPSLRNVALTGPWGHDGAYNTLEAVVRHHLDPQKSLSTYDVSQAVLPSCTDLDEQDFIVHNDEISRTNLASSIEINPVALTDYQIKQLLDFLHALTDPNSLDLRSTAPKRVPSGLSLAD